MINLDACKPLSMPFVHQRFKGHLAHFQLHWVCQYGHAARARNQFGRLCDLDLRLRHIAAFSRQQVFVKRVTHRVRIPRLNQRASQLHHAIQRNLRAVFTQLTHHLLRARLPLHRAHTAEFQHSLVVRIKAIAENVNLLLRAAAQLHAGDQRHAAVARLVLRAQNALHAVMIRQRQMGKAHLCRQRNQLVRFQRAVRRGGMKMQIRFHVVSS